MGERTDEVTGGGADTRNIRRDIEQTQKEMSRTIDEIQHRLSPHYMMERTKDSLREAGVKTSRGIVDRIRENPIPAAMVGIGLFLMMRNRDENVNTVEFTAYPEWDRNRTYSSVADYRDLEFEGGGRFAGTRDRVGETVNETRERVSGAVGSAVGTAREATGEALHSASEQAHHLAELARRRAHIARMQSRDILQDRPLVAGIAALAMGAIVGALIPETERENELLGQTRDKFAERAKDMAREQIDRAKNIAASATAAATDAAKNAAKSSGSTKTDVGQNVGVGTDFNR